MAMKMKEVEDLLNGIISESLSGPCGDPGWENLHAAASAWKVLTLLNLEIREPDYEYSLREGNICDNDFLEGMGLKNE